MGHLHGQRVALVAEDDDMSRVTLEDAAQLMDLNYIGKWGDRYQEAAAVCRAAQKVIDVAITAIKRGDGTIGHDLPFHRMEYTPEWNDLRAALAELDKAEQSSAS